MTFQNDVLDVSSLPRYETAPLTPIDVRYRKIILWNAVIFALFTGALAVFFFVVDDFRPYRWLALAFSILAPVLWGILQLWAFKRKGYAVREHDVIYVHGVLSVKTTVVPFNRIQHVSVKEGVFSRIYGLASVQIFTAGGTAADLQVRGLDKTTAEKIRNLILQKI